MRRAFIFCIIAVMRAVEGIAFRIVRTLVIKIQFRAAVGTEQKTGTVMLFCPLLFMAKKWIGYNQNFYVYTCPKEKLYMAMR